MDTTLIEITGLTLLTLVVIVWVIQVIRPPKEVPDWTYRTR